MKEEGDRCMRSIQLKMSQERNTFNDAFPRERDGIIYVRQSSLAQMRNNIHSYELQTDQFVEHLRKTMGCTGHIEIITDDEALSGTLEIQARPGMVRLMKLVETEMVGWIATVAVNRLTRDKWLVTPSLLMKTCYEHHVWITTLSMHFNFQDPYCQRVFMLEAEEAARHLEWMRLMLGGALRAASSKGYYDGRWVVPGYIVDRTDPLRKKYVVYPPHAEKVRWLFLRFLQLDGDFPALCREVQQMPYLFPKFESWVDTRKMKFSLHRPKKGARPSRTGEGHYKPTKKGLLSILTNPVYIGWWLPIDGGVIEGNHEAIVEEVLFLYAHQRLSTYTLDGERQKPVRVIRHGKVEALLKKVIKAESGQSIYPSPDKGGQYRCCRSDGYISSYCFTLPLSLVDTIFLETFFDHLLQGTWHPDYEDWRQALQRQKASKHQQKQSVVRYINEAQRQRQETMDILDDPDIPKTKQMKIEYGRKIVALEAQIAQWKMSVEASEGKGGEEQERFRSIEEIISEIITSWDQLPFEKRMRFVNALVQHVQICRLSPGWFQMEIQWKRPDWENTNCLFHRTANREAWTPEEDALLTARYANETAETLMKALPDKTWSAIEHRASLLHVKKVQPALCQALGFASNKQMRHLCWLDIQFAEERGISSTVRSVLYF
jgi:DNA invertase Pin-like site-specific DNA recombinase